MSISVPNWSTDAEVGYGCFNRCWQMGQNVPYGPEDGLTLRKGACDGFLEKLQLRFILK